MLVSIIGFVSAVLLMNTQTLGNPNGDCLGAYLQGSGGVVTISKFDLGDGLPRLVLVDFHSGTIRILKETESGLTAGPTLLSDSPIGLRVTCGVQNLQRQTSDAPTNQAHRIRLREENVKFRSNDVDLAGTLYLPEGSPPYPALVLLHGSGPLTRYSFGPMPHFFAASGFAVLAYDKRGTGQSTGSFDSATFDQLAQDGSAAVSYLKTRKDIDAGKIGLWGSSQGGFLAAAVAARASGLRFLINHSGMYVPAWQQEIYRTKSEMQAEGYSQDEIATAMAYLNQFFEVAKTGNNWEKLQSRMAELKSSKWFDLVAKTADLKSLQWSWQNVYSYDPAVALEKVNCPVLGVFGGLDKSTPVPETIGNMKRALEKARNANFESRIFPNADHGMLDAKTGSDSEIPTLTRIVPEAFELERAWALKMIRSH
jgi:uncharacterized protein